MRNITGWAAFCGERKNNFWIKNRKGFVHEGASRPIFVSAYVGTQHQNTTYVHADRVSMCSMDERVLLLCASVVCLCCVFVLCVLLCRMVFAPESYSGQDDMH